MKTYQLILGAALGALPLVGAAATAADQNVRTEVAFFEPEKFTDVRDTHMGTAAESGYLEPLREHIVRQAQRYVPAGYTLAVTFTDIDMAGDFEPWHGPRFHDIRIVKDLYPPRATLSFRLVDSEGNVVKEGQRALRDMAFMMKIPMGFRDDPLRHEKALIDDWLRSEFARMPQT